MLGIDSPNFILVSGKPAAGKSHFIKYLLMTQSAQFSKNALKYGVVFTTTKFNRAYEEFIPSGYIHSAYKPEVLQSLLDIQAANPINRAFVIFDDCLPAAAFSSQLFTNLATTFRHYNLTVIISTQYIYKVPPTVREVATRVAMFKMTTKRSIAALFESFGGMWNSYQEFAAQMQKSTGDFKFIYYFANSSSENRDDVYKVMKAPVNVPEFQYEY